MSQTLVIISLSSGACAVSGARLVPLNGDQQFPRLGTLFGIFIMELRCRFRMSDAVDLA